MSDTLSYPRPGARPGDYPDVERLPDAALLTRRQLINLTGFTNQAFKKWAREGRGPAIT